MTPGSQALPDGLVPLKIAIVGHTNTGKTSLVRTLTRDANFGDVSNRAATTRCVEGSTLLVKGRPFIELYDTPGLEDPGGLLELIDGRRGDGRADWIDVIEAFLASDEARGRFSQEAQAIRQVLASDAALYVVDARDRVLGKNRDELEILGRCARPVVPVLNFVAGSGAQTAAWRAHLGRINMHAIAEFDTVVFDATGEQRLFETMRVLLARFRPTLDALIAERASERARLVRSAAELLADLLIDAAAFSLIVPETEIDRQHESIAALQRTVRDGEQRCIAALLELFRFTSDAYEADRLPLEDGQWGIDLFSPAALRQFGIRAGSAAAAGGLAGVAIDVVTGGLSLGAAAILGAALGALWGSVATHGRRLGDVFRGFTELKVTEETLRLLAARETLLIEALLRRGHAAQQAIPASRSDEDAVRRHAWMDRSLPETLVDARIHPEWSRFAVLDARAAPNDRDRTIARDRLADQIEHHLAQVESQAIGKAPSETRAG
ncbi:MAG: GTPase/DUF3482 domain-containing protein [Rhodospirillales bacterium]|nr:GTPase/DUF3482 domain-containing protein [Rhodospirillales bacterium]